ISIEATEIGYRRAKFNRPFRTVSVKHGLSYDVLPDLLNQTKLTSRPWFLWLDYDGVLDEDKVEEFRNGIERLPPNSIFLNTFPATASKYGRPAQRPRRLRRLLGSVVPDDLSRDQCDDNHLSETLLNLTTDFMIAAAADSARPGGFVPAFR